ncbi:hypothetical protein BHE74_00008943 [Ensete ventricosum]|nr:hypothetical protein BHE74_00008943 [Ensete ventricosum]
MPQLAFLTLFFSTTYTSSSFPSLFLLHQLHLILLKTILYLQQGLQFQSVPPGTDSTYRSVRLPVCGPPGTAKIDRRRSIEGEKGKKKKRKRRKKKTSFPRAIVARGSPTHRPRPWVILLPREETEHLPARGERSRRRHGSPTRHPRPWVILLPREETEHLPAGGERSRRRRPPSSPVGDSSTTRGDGTSPRARRKIEATSRVARVPSSPVGDSSPTRGDGTSPRGRRKIEATLPRRNWSLYEPQITIPHLHLIITPSYERVRERERERERERGRERVICTPN